MIIFVYITIKYMYKIILFKQNIILYNMFNIVIKKGNIMFLKKNILLSTVLIGSIGLMSSLNAQSEADKNGFFTGLGLIILNQKGNVKDNSPQEILVAKNGALGKFKDKTISGIQYSPYLQFGGLNYFDSNQEHGLRYGVYIGSSFVNKFMQLEALQELQDTLKYLNLKFGFDIRYNWDFIKYNFGSNIWEFGLDIGAIFEMNYYRFTGLNHINRAKEKHGPTEDQTRELIKKHAENLFSFTHGVQPLIGLHWYINGSHLINIAYSFDILKGGGSSQGKKDVRFGETSEKEKAIFSFSTTNYSYISYAYKF